MKIKFFILLIFTLVFTSCSVSDDEKIIVIGSGQSPDTMDTLNAYDGWYSIRYGITQTLTKMNDDYTISGWLVEDDYFSNEENTVWTFVIKDDVTFSNGNIVDANAVKLSLENVFQNSERVLEYFSDMDISAEGNKLTIETENPDPLLPNKLADPLFSVIDISVDNSNIAETGPIGTGPFVLESFDYSTKECVVLKNENYWSNSGEVKSEKIKFVYNEEQSVLSMGLQSGEYDAVYNVSMNDVEIFEVDENFKVERNPSGRTTIGFMNQNGKLKDNVLREVIIEMQDREVYAESLLKNQYVAGKTLLTPVAEYGYESLEDPNKYNPDLAIKKLSDAGYKDLDGDGYLETPNGEQINLSYVYYTGRPEQQILVEATEAVMKSVGIKITPQVYDTQSVLEKQKKGEYDLLCMSINMMNCGDPENQINTFFRSDGSYNASGFNNEEFDEILNKLHITSKIDERKEFIISLEKILLDESVAIFYCYPIMNFVMDNSIQGIKSTPTDFYWINENTYKEEIK